MRKGELIGKSRSSGLRSMRVNNDSFVNAVTGMGMTKASNSTVFLRSYVNPQEQRRMFNYDWMTRKACNKPASDSMRKWIVGDLKDAVSSISLQKHLVCAVGMARGFGGAAILVIAKDGKDMSEQLAPGAEIDRLVVVDRWEVSRQHDGSNNMFFDTNELYVINGVTVHKSRVIEIKGLNCTSDHYRHTDFWGASLIESAAESIISMNEVYNAIRDVVKDASIGVVKSPALGDASCSEELINVIQNRLDQVHNNKSSWRTIAIDSEEDFSWMVRTFAGVKDIADIFQLRIAAVFGIPESILFGKNNGSMGSAEDKEQNAYNDLLLDVRTNYCDDVINWFANHFGLDWEWMPIDQSSPAELADIRLKNAQSLQIEADLMGLSDDEGRAVIKAAGLDIHEGISDNAALITFEDDDDEQVQGNSA